MFIKIGSRIVNADQFTVADFTAAGTYGEETDVLVLHFGYSEPEENRFRGDEAATLWTALITACEGR
jgi:hypothetical protein